MMYSNNILNFQESTTILNVPVQKKSENLWKEPRISYQTIGLMSTVFANGPGDWVSILGRGIPKTHKYYLMPLCLALNTIR